MQSAIISLFKGLDTRMTIAEQKHSNALTEGFYTVRDAARYLRIDSPQKIRGWLAGYQNSQSQPIILRTYQPQGRFQEISFLDLMEMRFIAHYRLTGISLQSLRKAAQTAREELKATHPFALSGVRFMNERKKIFLETASALEDKKLLDLITKQFTMYEAIEKSLEVGVDFNEQGLAQQWTPNANLAPDVFMNPSYAFGQPVVGEKAVSTKAIFNTYSAEDGNIERVADWYGISSSQVDQAVKFEASIATC